MPVHAAGELEIDVHAVMRQQDHRIGVLRAAQIVDQLLQLLLADAERPIGRETFRMRDRHIGKGLADDGDAHAADLFHRRRFEDAAGFRIERRLVVEGRVLGQKNILRQKLAFEAGEVLAQRGFAVGEFPMPGHGIDAEQVRGVDHVGALRRIGETGALPHVAAVEEERIVRAGIGAQPVDQGFQMRKAAHAAVAVRGVLIIEEGEGMGDPAARHDVEMFQESAADDMRRFSTHVADADIDARLAEIDRLQLGVGVGQMQDADIAEAADVVEIVVGRQRHARRDARSGSDAKPAQEIPAIQARALLVSE